MDVFDDIDDTWYFFKSCLFSVLDQYAPLKTVKSKVSKRPTPWMTPELLLFIKEKNKAKRRASKTHSTDDIAAHKLLKNKLKTAIHEAKLHCFKMLVKQSKSDPHLSSQLWSSVNDIIGLRQTCDSGVSSIISPDSLNEFFCNVAVFEAHQTADQFQMPPTSPPAEPFRFSTICSDSVYRILQNLYVRNSTGADGLSARFLEEVSIEITEPLIKLYNASLRSGSIPRDWKQSIITAVHKSGSRDDPSNFRPIFQLCQFLLRY